MCNNTCPTVSKFKLKISMRYLRLNWNNFVKKGKCWKFMENYGTILLNRIKFYLDMENDTDI